MRVKAVYVVNNSILFNIVWTILKPFLNRDLTDKFYIERSDFTRLAKAIGPSSLEKRYNGNIENNLPFGKNLIDAAEAFQSEFEGIFFRFENFKF